MKAVLERLRSELDRRRTAHLLRSRHVVDQRHNGHICIDGKTLLDFSSNDYLGLACHPDLVEALKQGADRYGVGSGAAHLVSGHSYAHHALEAELADFCGRERALLFSTGYMANLGIITALVDKHSMVFEDKLNHASMIDAGLLSAAGLQRYLHADTRNLAGRLDKSDAAIKLIASDGVFSMDGDIAPARQLAVLARQHHALLMIDDAHGLGVLGDTGGGILEHLSLGSDDVPILMGTLGKAFGTFGAFVAADNDLVETLIQTARPYIYTTALPPAIAHATRKSLDLVMRESWRREKLQNNIRRFRMGATELGLQLKHSDTAIQPVLIRGVDTLVAVGDKLQQQGILVGVIRPPTVPLGTERLRITLSASHGDQDIDRLLEALERST